MPAVGVAQLVELLVVVQVVAGSSPVAHPSRKPRKCAVFAFTATQTLSRPRVYHGTYVAA
jgi:hypothetical protein